MPKTASTSKDSKSSKKDKTERSGRKAKDPNVCALFNLEAIYDEFF